MSSDLVILESSNPTDLESWNHNILSFGLDRIEAASADPVGIDQRIAISLAALFGEQSPVGVEPCDEFHCSGYW